LAGKLERLLLIAYEQQSHIVTVIWNQNEDRSHFPRLRSPQVSLTQFFTYTYIRTLLYSAHACTTALLHYCTCVHMRI